jgi:germination protein M
MKRKIMLLAGCLCLSVMLASCGKRTDVGKEDPFIYCLNEDRTGLTKISYDFPEGNSEETARAVLEELKEPAEEIEYTAPIPKEVKVQGCRLRGSILDVDFNSAYLEMGALEEKLVRAAVVQSLVLIDGINAVSFTVDGEMLKDSTGFPVGLMNEDDFVENTGSSPTAYQTDTLTLYFADKEGDSLVPREVDVRYSSNVSREKLIVEKLMQGPSGSGAYPTINPDANLLSVTIKDGICYVNFDSTFLTGAYDVLPEVTVYSIVNSLVEGTEAQQVQITINGETDAKYMETVDLSQPLEEKEELVAAEE